MGVQQKSTRTSASTPTKDFCLRASVVEFFADKPGQVYAGILSHNNWGIRLVNILEKVDINFLSTVVFFLQTSTSVSASLVICHSCDLSSLPSTSPKPRSTLALPFESAGASEQPTANW